MTSLSSWMPSKNMLSCLEIGSTAVAYRLPAYRLPIFITLQTISLVGKISSFSRQSIKDRLTEKIRSTAGFDKRVADVAACALGMASLVYATPTYAIYGQIALLAGAYCQLPKENAWSQREMFVRRCISPILTIAALQMSSPALLAIATCFAVIQEVEKQNLIVDIQCMAKHWLSYTNVARILL